MVCSWDCVAVAQVNQHSATQLFRHSCVTGFVLLWLKSIGKMILCQETEPTLLHIFCFFSGIHIFTHMRGVYFDEKA